MKNPFKFFFEDLKFKKKIVLYTSMMLYLFTMCMGLLLFFRATNIFDEMAHTQMTERMQQLEKNIVEEVKSYEKIVSTTLLDNEFQNKLEKKYENTIEGLQACSAIQSYLASLCSGYVVPPVTELYINNATILATNSVFYVQDIENQQWYLQHRKDAKNTTRWRFEADEKNPNGVFICTTGIMNKYTRNVSAYLRLSISMSCIKNYLEEVADDTVSVVFLRDKSGNLLWKSDGNTAAETYNDAVDKTPLIGSGSSPVKINNQAFELYYVNYQKYGFGVVCVKKANTATATYMNFGRFFLVVILAVIILSLVTTLLSVNLISKRLSTLTNKVRAVNERNPVFINDIKGVDELGELGRAFEDALCRVRALIESNKQMERERFKLEFKALQSQINPHFLFNTLSIINIQATEIQADNISDSLSALAEFYRLSLSNGDSLIMVHDEMKMLECYIKICRIRYRSQLNVIFNIDGHAEDCYMPKLLLQPFIENSVFHGFLPHTSKVPTIHFRISQVDESVVFTISDNGQGIDPQTLENVMNGKSFAISNVNSRIKLLYGDEYGVQISSIVGEGTTVVVTIPAIESEQG